MYLVTAGHCAKLKISLDNNVETQTETDESVRGDIAYEDTSDFQDEDAFIIRNTSFDCAILPVTLPKSFQFMNPWYFDDDIFANEEYFKELQRNRSPSFDSSVDDISLVDDYPFIDLSMLTPGTEIVKMGASTGITSGRLIGSRTVEYSESGVNYCAEYAVVVRWDVGQRFTAGGDSGSVYYAKLGSFTFPIAIHRGAAYIKTPNYLEPGGQPLLEVISFGTPLNKVISEIKNRLCISNIRWSKSFSSQSL